MKPHPIPIDRGLEVVEVPVHLIPRPKRRDRLSNFLLIYIAVGVVLRYQGHLDSITKRGQPLPHLGQATREVVMDTEMGHAQGVGVNRLE